MFTASLLLLVILFGIISAQQPSNNGRCGASLGLTCGGTSYGQCCSSAGWCGTGTDYCGVNCQTGYGNCTIAIAASSSPAPKPISTDARCGSKYGGQTCLGSGGGNCCSIFGYCGSSYDFCRTDRCQVDYGTCSDALPSAFTSSARPSGNYAICPAPSVTITSTVAQDVLTLMRTITSISTSTVSQDPVTISATITLGASAAVSAMNTVTQSFTATVTTISIPAAVTQNQTISLTSTSVITTTSIPSAVTVTTTQTTTLSQIMTQTATITTNPALLNLGAGASVTVTATATVSVTSAFTCPTDQPVGNPSFESASLSPWIPLSAGVVTSGRVAGGASLSGYAYRFSIDAANPNLPQRLIQSVSLCQNSTYSLKFNSRQSIATGTVSIVGGVQVGTSALLQMAGGAITGTTLYAAAGSIGSLVVPAGMGAMAGVLVIEATFGPSGVLGTKEAYIDEIILTKT